MKHALVLLLIALAACATQPAPPSSVAPAAPRIRVFLRDASSREAVTLVAASYRLLDEEARVLEEGSSLERSIPAFGATLAGVLRLQTSAPFAVDGRSYPGELLLVPAPEGVRLIVETDLESYVPGVLAGELGPAFPPAALRAQAVASRTYALFRMQSADPEKGWHVTDDTGSQVWLGHAPALVPFAADTRGLILSWHGAPLPAFFHSTCGGHTAPVDVALGATLVPPLAGVPCEFCSISKYFRWEARVPLEEAARALGLPSVPHSVRMDGIGRDGRPERLLFDLPPEAELPATDVRAALGHSRIRSTRLLTVEVQGGELFVHGGGWGHGAGLCQMGGVGLARSGASASDILAHYYPGADLFRLY